MCILVTYKVVLHYVYKGEWLISRKIEVEAYGLIITSGIGLASIGGLPLLGYTISGLGIAGALMEFMELRNPYRKLFESLKLKTGEDIPKYIGKRITDYGYCITLSLPTGLCLSDFEKHKEAIEQNLNREVEFNYNNHRVYMKIFENRLSPNQQYQFTETRNICEFPIGVSFGDQIITVDMEEVTHLLIAGQTGSGKSTLVRGIITNLIKDKTNSKKYKLYLHLIDLKNGAEFNVFKKCKIVKTFSRDIDSARGVLRGLTEEVELRYDLFYANDVVDIREYNKLRGLKKLSYEICIVDEFADLQDEKGGIKLVEQLARKARAAGIHLILATQRPSADIINGNIKANVPATIGLKTRNSLNSRIIIDQDGLEKLRGKGHGYLQFADLVEFQSMFLEVEDARELIKETYVEEIVKKTTPPKDSKGKVDNLLFLKDLIK